ncbi:uncharacterized protein LODBEIA_P24640 [Lodderomyces beijingensis]|uniref:Ebp2-domain-containing protein n=1 Tax=Lodderomyces beijingensis TaxID=1775926 RepID=A0ABP0ZM17_9ASCO
MARGTLKQQLKSHQSKTKSENGTFSQSHKKSKKLQKDSEGDENLSKAALTREEAPPVVAPALGPKAKSAKKTSESDLEDYKSGALSKKEQRKLKKLQNQQTPEAEEAEEEEEEEKMDEDVVEGELEEDESEDAEEELDYEKLAASESESDLDDDDDDDDVEEEEEDKEEEEAEEEQEDVPLSDVEYDSDADVIPHTKLTINNMAALRESLARIAIPWSKHSFIEHQSVVSAEPAESSIKDIYDDTERELAFYKQGLDAVKQARATLLKLNVPFSRPVDYFAEMVKSDEHMDKLKTKLLSEAADKKASEDAKKQRQLKKFGKQVQHETLQQRAKQKKETLEKIKSLKKKRGANEISNDDDFQIALEEATKEDGYSRGGGDNKRRKPNGKRMAKNAKYGSGGMKRGSRKNDAASSADITGFSNKNSKGKSSRPGKSKRSRR